MADHHRRLGKPADRRPTLSPGERPVGCVDVAAILLAAGEGRRFGGIKQLAMLDAEPMVHRGARLLLETATTVIVVTGAHAGAVQAALDDLPVHRVCNPAWFEGVGSSLAVGFRYLMEHFAAVTGALLSLADQPMPNGDLVHRMLRRHAQAPDLLLAALHGDAVGPPVLFPSDCFAELSRWSGTAGARAMLRREAGRLETFSANLPVDVDTPADLEQAIRQLREHRKRQ